MITANTTPTPEAIEALALELARFHSPKSAVTLDLADVLESEYADAAWILSRFVRREEHCKDCCCARSWAALGEVSGADSIAGHIESMRAERDRLRAELRGQRCNGSGTIRIAMGNGDKSYLCIGCPACKPDATPKGDGGRWAKAIAAADPGRDDCSCVPPESQCTYHAGYGGRTPESVSTAGGVHDDSPVQSAAPVLPLLTVAGIWAESRSGENQEALLACIGQALVEIRDELARPHELAPYDRCWSGRFDVTGAPGCDKPGRWHKPNALMPFSRACRWCDEHKHDDDVLVESDS